MLDSSGLKGTSLGEYFYYVAPVTHPLNVGFEDAGDQA